MNKTSNKTEELKKIEEELMQQKIKIADTALKWHATLHPRDECDDRSELCGEYMRRYREWELFELMSAYDDIEDRYIKAGGKGRTY